MTDVLLINPGEPKTIFQGLADEFTSIEPPVFCGLFATYLRRKGVNIAICDAPAMGYSPAQVAEVFADLSPSLVVIVVYGAQPSASTQNMTSALAIARAIRESNKGPVVPIMMTGTHLAALPEETLEDAAGDVTLVCDLEGPETIYKAWKWWTGPRVGLPNIPSLWTYGAFGEIKPPRSTEPLIKNLDGDMSGIAWDLLPMDRYRSHNWHAFDHLDRRSPYAAIHTSLGCPWKCHFCCINAPFGKSAYRMWSPQVVLAEIDYLARNYGVVNLKFVDEMFVLNRNHVRGICEGLRDREYKVNIWAYARVDTVGEDPYFLDLMKEAGINWLCLGIESASQHVRDGAHKKYGNEDIIDVVRRIQAAGIYVIGNFIFGLPDDTEDRMRQTLNLALELRCEYANFYSAMAYPGSPLFNQARMEGCRLPETWADYSQHGYGCLPLANDHCSSEQILRFRDSAFRRYFADSGYLGMVRSKFGQHVVDHIGRMLSVPLKRKILGD